MRFLSSRRRLLAAFAAVGVGGVTGRARAETVPCSYASLDGTAEKPANNFRVTATEAEFVYMAWARALADGVQLAGVTPEGGVAREGIAALKGRFVRDTATRQLRALEIAFDAPIAAFEQEGQFYPLVGVAYEQKVPVGYVFISGEVEVGSYVFDEATNGAENRIVGFSGVAAEQLHNALMTGTHFVARLTSGGVAYAEFSVLPNAYPAFIDSVLVPKMNEMAAADIADACEYVNHADYLDGFEDCFLTSACCAVVGLADDCWELRTLRQFRDEWMMRFEAGRQDVARYYREAPAVAQKLVASEAGRARLLGLYWRVIVPAALLIRVGLKASAYRLYRRMMTDLLAPGGS